MQYSKSVLKNVSYYLFVGKVSNNGKGAATASFNLSQIQKYKYLSCNAICRCYVASAINTNLYVEPLFIA